MGILHLLQLFNNTPSIWAMEFYPNLAGHVHHSRETTGVDTHVCCIEVIDLIKYYLKRNLYRNRHFICSQENGSLYQTTKLLNFGVWCE